MHRLKFYALMGWATVLLATVAFGQQRSSNLFTVGNIRAQADAENAVEAKKLATLSAETQALRRLLIKLTDFRSHSRLPEVPEAEVEQYVSNIDVRNEGFSGTTYVATFTVTFSERGVRALLGRNGMVLIEERAPELLILPVFIEGGAARTTDRNPWRNALAQMDLANALTPAKLAPTRSDISAAIANAYVANPKASLETLKTQHRASLIVLAVAEVDANGEVITLKLLGTDTLGTFVLQRKIKSKSGVDDDLIRLAARLVLATLEQRWKLTRGIVTASVISAPSSAGNSGSSSSGMSSFSGGSSQVEITALYSGLKEWQAIRSRLQRIPGVQNLDTKAVNPRSASVTFDFPGGAERLSTIAPNQGLSLENSAEGWIMKTR